MALSTCPSRIPSWCVILITLTVRPASSKPAQWLPTVQAVLHGIRAGAVFEAPQALRHPKEQGQEQQELQHGARPGGALTDLPHFPVMVCVPMPVPRGAGRHPTRDELLVVSFGSIRACQYLYKHQWSSTLPQLFWTVRRHLAEGENGPLIFGLVSPCPIHPSSRKTEQHLPCSIPARTCDPISNSKKFDDRCRRFTLGCANV